MKGGMNSATPKPHIVQLSGRTRRSALGAARRHCGTLALLLGLGGGCADQHNSPSILVAAAASLRDVATELGREYERQSGTRVDFNFAGSNVLAHQIAAAARVDVFLSADQRWIDFLAEHDQIVHGSRQIFLHNKLVVVAREDCQLPITRADDLATCNYKHLVIADPEAVPAGRYTKSWLESRQHGGGTLWQAVAPMITPALDVRAALALVESDPAMVGVVYLSDQRSSKRTRILFEPTADQQPEIDYGAALIAVDSPSQDAGRFLDFLVGEKSRATFARYGFGAPK